MKDYLGYNIILCQNITDIDDKIIIRSSERQIGFRELAAQYEAEFMEDMASLGVPLPDMMTRVSEYIPEIVAFIETLISKGVAYEANGSVYFSTSSFELCGHVYGKLEPEKVGNADLLAEGEGALATNEDKRNPADFALWKKTKEHSDGMTEPSWASPWGNGRPGWHIECSAMSKYALEKFGGTSLDVHAGGIDLKFPHHENEIAQSEGNIGCKQWTNYWFHTGHLHIKGFKMSKSLKNFITIRAALTRHSSRQIRFCFLLHKYNAPMDYGDDTMTQAVSIERIFSEFFHNVKAVLRRLGISGPQHVGALEANLLLVSEATKEGVRAALLDDFDTPRAINHLLELLRESNRYIENGEISTVTLSNVAKYITSILRLFGLVPEAGGDIGFPLEAMGDGEGSFSKEQVLAPYLDVLTKFRESVRVAAISGDTAAVLRLADALRDDVLPDLGVRMEDKGSGADVVSVWKLDDPEVLRKEKALKIEAKAAKEAQRVEAERKKREKEEKAKISPDEMFKSQTGLYSAFDTTGRKEMQKQKELFDKYAAKESGGEK
jgi:cysteinyl-tRNA synthetase